MVTLPVPRYRVQGFLQDDKPSAQELFSRAALCFKKCSAQDPSNETYKKAIEMCEKVSKVSSSKCLHANGHGGEERGLPGLEELSDAAAVDWLPARQALTAYAPTSCSMQQTNTFFSSFLFSIPCSLKISGGPSTAILTNNSLHTFSKLELTTPTQAPEYYDEIQAHIQAQLVGEMTGGAAAAKAPPNPTDFWYDVGGWVVLGAVLVGTMFLAKASAKAS